MQNKLLASLHYFKFMRLKLMYAFWFFVIPFFVDFYKGGWAYAKLRLLWRLCISIIPKPTIPEDNSDNSNSSTDASNDDGPPPGQ